ncbi:uncharacterized protein LOC117779906 [Drosophila innubila]|uniref:uncharacterized protein LOC117779906 n=1 Tax=Drosophila innubila TaxID=198719 RepID=UPI00148D5C2F|nr:uncharacterized protein LOC117779906 [Drosophila innubila]
MFKKSALSFLLFATCLAIAVASQSGSGDSSGKKAVTHAQVQPRFLWIKRAESKPQQPIVLLQQPHSESDRHHHHHPPHWSDYYPYPPPPPRPNRPPFNIPGLSEYLGSGPSIVIINPNNAQNLTFPAAAAPAADAGGGTGGTGGTGRNSANRRSSNPIVDLLQDSILDDDTEVITVPENAEAEGDALASQQQQQQQQQVSQSYYGGEERDEDYGEDELALLERQAARGLSPKHLLSFLLQDKRRRRIQEAVAGIYLRNYNLNRK